MTKIQVVENENLLQYADFANCEVWLLNRTTDEPLASDVINMSEVTESSLSSSIKFPKLMTEMYNKYGNNFTYEVITDNADNFSFKAYTCDYEKIKVVGK